MYKNFLLVALRNLFNNKVHSLISIIGLALGVAAAVVIFIVNYSELTWDSEWQDADRIFVLERHGFYSNKVDRSVATSPSLKQAIEESHLDIEAVGRTKRGEASVGSSGTVSATQQGFDEVIVEMDPSIIEILNLTAIKGNLSDFHSDKHAVVITAATAKKYFGSEEPIGKILTIDKRILFGIPESKSQAAGALVKDYKVVAVIADMRPRVSLAENFNILVNYTELPGRQGNSWNSYMGPTYVKLKEGVTLESVHKALIALVDKYIPSDQAVASGKKTSDILTLTLLNIKDVHLYSNTGVDGAMQRIGMLYGLAAIILLLAGINYINLSTAGYSLRQKEVALRKTLGSSKWQIIVQFMLEAAITMATVLFFVLVLLEPIIPWLSSILEIQLKHDYFTDVKLLALLVFVMIFLGLAAGFYPGFYLSQVRPANILKANKSYEMIGSARLRYALVVVQFVISGAMLVCVALIAAQIHRALNYDPGYATKDIVYLSEVGYAEASYAKRSTLKHEISQLPGVKAVAQAAHGMGVTSEMNTSVSVAHLGKTYAEGVAMEAVVIADVDEMKLLDIPLLAGKYFEYSYPIEANADTADEFEENSNGYTTFDKVILNPEAVAALGFTSAAEAIGAQVSFYWSEKDRYTRTVIGVTDEVHLNSRREPLHPAIFWFSENSVRAGTLGIAIAEHADKTQLLDKAKALWKLHLGRVPSESSIESALANRYRNEIIFSNFVYAFAALALAISCLGLYGLASFAAERRTKEIGLRKVHGASVPQLVFLLLWQFTQPVALASIIAWPIALYCMAHWLENFNQRIDLWLWGPIYCVLAGALSVAIAWLTVGGKALMVARAKPGAALREE